MQLLEYIDNKIAAKEKELECPVCFEVASAPIFMCSDLHLICSDCKPKVTSFPFLNLTSHILGVHLPRMPGTISQQGEETQIRREGSWRASWVHGRKSPSAEYIDWNVEQCLQPIDHIYSLFLCVFCKMREINLDYSVMVCFRCSMQEQFSIWWADRDCCRGQWESMDSWW